GRSTSAPFLYVVERTALAACVGVRQDPVGGEAVADRHARFGVAPPYLEEVRELTLEAAGGLDIDLLDRAIRLPELDTRALVVDERRPLGAIHGHGPLAWRCAPAALDDP